MGSISLSVVQQVVQRVAGAGAVTISGTCVGATSVEARVLDYATGTVVAKDWTLIDAASSATFSGVLTGVPAGGWYRVQVRLGNETSTVADSHDTGNKFGVGDFIYLLGQSNACYLWYRADDETGIAYPTNIPDLACRYGRQDPTFSGLNSDADGLISYAKRYVAAENVPVCFMCYAASGTYLGAQYGWLDETPCPDTVVAGKRDLYVTFRNSLATMGLSPAVPPAAIVWYQGEGDSALFNPASTVEYSSSPDTYDRYVANLTALFAKFRVDCGATVPILCPTLARHHDTVNSDLVGWEWINTWQDIRDAQAFVLARTANAYRLDTIDLPLRVETGTELLIHLAVAGRTTLGDRLAYAHLAHFDPTTYPITAPRITEWKPISPTQTVVYTTGGLVVASGLQGWHLYDEYYSPVAVSAAVCDGTSITLTHDPVTIKRTIEYGCRDDAFGTGAAAPTLARASNSLVLPLAWANSPPMRKIGRINNEFVSTGDNHAHPNASVLRRTNAAFTTELLALIGQAAGGSGDFSGTFTGDILANVLSITGKGDIPWDGDNGFIQILRAVGNNLFIGSGAGNSGVDPYATNNAAGTGAGAALTTGTNNSLQGNKSGNSLTTGSYNTMEGASSGRESVDGNRNYFSGNSSGRHNVHGSNNTNVGAGSGDLGTNSSVSNTLFLGADMGSFNSPYPAADYGVQIGVGAYFLMEGNLQSGAFNWKGYQHNFATGTLLVNGVPVTGGAQPGGSSNLSFNATYGIILGSSYCYIKSTVDLDVDVVAYRNIDLRVGNGGATLTFDIVNLPRLAQVIGGSTTDADSAHKHGQYALAAAAFGVGQSYSTDLGPGGTSARASNTIYQNTTARPIYVNLTMSHDYSGSTGLKAQVDSVSIVSGSPVADISVPGASGLALACRFVVPPGGYYRVKPQAGNGTVVHWYELM